MLPWYLILSTYTLSYRHKIKFPPPPRTDCPSYAHGPRDCSSRYQESLENSLNHFRKYITKHKHYNIQYATGGFGDCSSRSN